MNRAIQYHHLCFFSSISLVLRCDFVRTLLTGRKAKNGRNFLFLQELKAVYYGAVLKNTPADVYFINITRVL